MRGQRQFNERATFLSGIDNNISGENKCKRVGRNAAILYVEVKAGLLMRRHLRNEEANSADTSGGRALEADEMAQGRNHEAGACLAS